MVSFTPTDPQTLEDQRLYTEERLTEVACLGCLARVRVKKNSEHHTSIQWSSEALAQCVEFAELDARPSGRPVYAACARLRSSIDQAVANGELQIGAQDGY